MISCLIRMTSTVLIDIYVLFIEVTVTGKTVSLEGASEKLDVELIDNRNGTAIARFTVSFFFSSFFGKSVIKFDSIYLVFISS